MSKKKKEKEIKHTLNSHFTFVSGYNQQKSSMAKCNEIFSRLFRFLQFLKGDQGPINLLLLVLLD